MLRTATLLAAVLALPLAGCAGSGLQVVKPPTPNSEHFDVAAAPSRAELRPAAIDEVLRAVRDEDPQMRAHALEAIRPVAERAVPMTQLALEDENAAVRFTALWVIGQERFTDLAPAVRPLFKRDQPDVVKAAVIYAATNTGTAREELISMMSRYVLHEDVRVRSTAAMLLGDMGEASAIPLLKQAARRPSDNRQPEILWDLMRVQAAEAMVKLGDGEAIKTIYGAAYSSDPEVQILATQTIARLDDLAFWANMSKFLDDDPIELRVAAAEGLVRLSKLSGGRDMELLQDAVREGAIPVLLEAARSDIATVRGQAALALGLSNTAEARAALAALLEDADASVRLAAAGGVLLDA